MGKVLLGVLLLLSLFAARTGAQTTTTVADVLFGPDGSKVVGSVAVRAHQDFTASDGSVVSAGSGTSVTVASNGSFSVALIPTIGAAPLGVYYDIEYATATKRIFEKWSVPVSSNPVKLSGVRVLWPTAPSVLIPADQFVPPGTCTPAQAAVSNLVLRYTVGPTKWICAPDNIGEASMSLENPSTTDTGKFQWKPKNALTISRVSCSTDSGTVTINLDQRSESNPNVSGSPVLSVPLLCGSSTADSTAFLNSSVAPNAPVSLTIVALTGAPNIVRVHVEYILN